MTNCSHSISEADLDAIEALLGLEHLLPPSASVLPARPGSNGTYTRPSWSEPKAISASPAVPEDSHVH
jgi:hypothetical protein